MIGKLTEIERRELIKGLEEHNTGKYFACHETLEDMWMAKGGDLRRFLQGLIHVAVGFYHLRDSNYVGAYRQLDKANTKLSDYATTEVGINLPELLSSLRVWLKNVQFLLDNPDSKKDFGRFPKFDYSAKKILAAV